MLQEIRFKAMGTTVAASLYSADAEQAQAVLQGVPAVLEEIEQQLSRFRKTSGLSLLNAAAGKGPQKVSPILAEVCGLALLAAEESQGLFDPTVLTTLVNLGYDDSFKIVAARADEGGNVEQPTERALWSQVVVGPDDTVSLPAGSAIDLGGIAKGWAADLVAEQLKEYGPAMVSIGGDVRTTGPLEDGQPWVISVADPFSPDYNTHSVALGDEAITTSGVGGRRWLRNGVWMHHLIDPRTQLPSTSEVHTVCVVGPSAVECEIAGKVALLKGLHEGAFYLGKNGFEGVLFDHSGHSHPVGRRFQVP